MKPKLTIELVPSTCWYSNVRSEVTPQQWDVICQYVYNAYEYKCGICGGKGERHPVECHEKWVYDDTELMQKLTGMIALCPSCHMVKHFGLAELRGDYDVAFKHLMKVNGWKKKVAEKYVDETFEIWNLRNKVDWILDIDFLKRFGIA